MNQEKIGALRVWHIPQVPGKAFRVPVDSLVQAKLVLDTLANYDLFQYENSIKPDYCNAAGLEVYSSYGNEEGDGPGWEEWCSNITGDGIDSIDADEAAVEDAQRNA